MLDIMILKMQYIFQYYLEHQRLISLFLHHQFSNFAIQAQPTSVPWEAYFSARELTTISKSEFRRIKVDQLKKYLTDSGIPSTGKKKDNLLELAVAAQRKYKVLKVCDHLNSELVSTSFGGTMPTKLISYLQFIWDVWSTSMESPVMPGFVWWHNSKTASYMYSPV